MDLVKNFTDREDGDIISELTRRGHSSEPANGLSPETLASLMQYLKGADFVDLFGSASLSGLDSLLRSVDITTLLREDLDFD